MELLLILIFCVIVLGVLSKSVGNKPFKAPDTKPVRSAEIAAFESVSSLWVNASEQAFFLSLIRNLPDTVFVHGKVRLEDIIRVKRGLPGKDNWAARGRVKARHIDFLITDYTGRPFLAIELDGSSHNRKNPSEADKFKTAVFAASDIPLQRVRVGEDFDLITAAIGRKLRGS